MVCRVLARLVLLTAPLLASPAAGGEADVIDARVTARGGGVFDFDVTIRSNDLGWDHFADGFEILAPDGTVLGTRTLLHPHETEQPFTRDLHGVAIPETIDQVTIRAHHKPKGFNGETLTVEVPR